MRKGSPAEYREPRAPPDRSVDRSAATLQVSFRGSVGYGRRHATAAVGGFGRAMQDDLVDAVDRAVTRPCNANSWCRYIGGPEVPEQ